MAEKILFETITNNVESESGSSIFAFTDIVNLNYNSSKIYKLYIGENSYELRWGYSQSQQKIVEYPNLIGVVNLVSANDFISGVAGIVCQGTVEEDRFIRIFYVEETPTVLVNGVSVKIVELIDDPEPTITSTNDNLNEWSELVQNLLK